MKGFSGFGNSPAKQKKDTTRTYPPSYTKEDIKFLKEQREDVVRYEDLDEKGKAIWRKQGKPVPKKKKSPAKQEGPIDKKQIKLQPSEHKDTWVYDPTKDDKSSAYRKRTERIIDLEERIGFIDEDANASGKPLTKQQKKDQAKLRQELAILRKSKHK